ncbi:hypothetical protein DFH07DRAFT_754427, partial [Mycena maculata]
HTYLDGIRPFTSLGAWAVGTLHSTATLSTACACGLYGLRLMHRLNISQSHHGHSAGWAPFFMSFWGPDPNPNVLTLKYIALAACQS